MFHQSFSSVLHRVQGCSIGISSFHVLVLHPYRTLFPCEQIVTHWSLHKPHTTSTVNRKKKPSNMKPVLCHPCNQSATETIVSWHNIKTTSTFFILGKNQFLSFSYLNITEKTLRFFFNKIWRMPHWKTFVASFNNMVLTRKLWIIRIKSYNHKLLSQNSPLFILFVICFSL